MADPTLTRLMRGFILNSLYANAPHPIAEKLLYRQLKAFYAADAKQFVRDLSYLHQLGHTQKKVTELAGVKVTSWTIAPTGMQLVEKGIEDPGVDFEDLD